MAGPIVGMDFGTTNSGMALFDGRQVQVLPLDPAAANPKVARTAIYLTNDQQLYIGRDAINRYLEQNVGRPSRLERVWVGEVEVRGADMFYVNDLYTLTDVLSPGRLFLSIKSGLREFDYQGTVVGPFYYALEDIIALYLTLTKQRAEKIVGQPVEEIVLGRPVRFAFTPEQDKLAQDRLLDSAFRAGYKKVYFQYEPIAAAYHYAQETGRTEKILVFDFGGGTLDITIMSISPAGERHILATSGIPIAGDVFDQKLVRTKLPRHFGEGSTYLSNHRSMPIPSWVYDIFSDWQHIMELQAPENRHTLQEIAKTAERPREIEALVSLVADNYALQMFDATEQAKRRLSEDMGTIIKFDGPKFNIRQLVTRTEFESLLRAEVELVEQHLQEILNQASLTPAEIDVVVRTGGSAEIPIFCRLLEEMFGAEKVRRVDTFSSVTAGLGIIAHQIQAGQLPLTGYTPADLPQHVTETRPNVKTVDLPLLQQRLALRQNDSLGQTNQAQLVVVQPGNNLQIVPLQDQQPVLSSPLSWVQTLTAGVEEHLLLVTSHYRFLRLTTRQLMEFSALNLSLAKVYNFKGDEEVCTLGRWARFEAAEWLTLVTSRGFARAYRLDTLRERLLAPTPFQLDDPLPGVPVAVWGFNQRDHFVVVNSDGRALAFPMNHSALRIRGVQVLNWKEGERVVGAHPAGAEKWLLVTAEGYGRVVLGEEIPVAQKHNEKPPTLSTRKPVVGLWPVADPLYLVSSDQLWQLPQAKLPPAGGSTKTTLLVKLGTTEKIVGLV